MSIADTSEYLTTRELAALLRIKERKVYELAAAGDVPVSRATGKLLFPRGAIEAWIARHSTGVVSAPAAAPAAVFGGSHDPLLEWALRECRAGLATYFDGSLDGVERFADRQAVAVGLHLHGPDGSWNTHLVAERFAADPVVLIEFAWRERGLVVARGREAEIAEVQNLAGRRVVPRQAEAGSQALLEHLLATAGVAASAPSWIPAARSELDAVLAIRQGKADAAFGLRGLAESFSLGFVPVLRERFDLLLDRRACFEPPLQRFFAFCASAAFRDKADELAGYDVRGFGQVHFNGA